MEHNGTEENGFKERLAQLEMNWLSNVIIVSATMALNWTGTNSWEGRARWNHLMDVVFKVSQITGHCKFRQGLSLNCSNGDQFNVVKSMSFKDGTTKTFGVSGEEGEEEIDEVVGSNGGLHGKRCDHVRRDDKGEVEGEGCYVEDHVFEMSLRKMVKVQRWRANAAEFELEKERMAAASAADEAMAMILRLQNEKGSLQMQVNQLHRLAEEKDMHGEGVIQSLELIVMNYGYESSLLVDQLRIYGEKLRPYLKDEEWDQCDRVCPTPGASPSSCDGGRFNDLLIGSLDLESFSL
ncbi:hypothetical protein Cgig2_014689 [Carnegiea gigantea]|uniref:GTD-binding domain-containing protein n=1 Tax=Carnegiea gigantea TaxID=171969 RepID=A0A9Q1QTG0_9CARY|nr:hypothetical protein Cgig2_014689 [Carnegiea gigantea]